MAGKSPYEYQLRSIEFARARHHSIIAHEPGLGKTMIAILASRLPALVVCPASVVLNWRREIDDWRPRDSSEFRVVSYAHPDLELLNPRKYRTVVVDEVHYIKNPTSRRSRIVCGLLRRVGRRHHTIALSGTLVPNRPVELWPLLYSTRITDMSYVEYARRYCAAYEDEWGQLDVRGASNLDELRELISPHCLRYVKEDVLPELPDRTIRVLALDLPVGRAEKHFSIDDLKRMDAAPAMEAMSTVLREQGRRKVPLVLEHVLNVLEGSRKVLLFAHHRVVIEMLDRGLRREGHRPVTIMGGMTARRKQAAVDLFQKETSRCRVLIGQVQAAGVGLNLTAADRVVFAEASWVPSDIEQAVDRAHRHGQKSHVLADLLTIHRSIDEHMLRRALEKKDVVEQIVPEDEFSGTSVGKKKHRKRCTTR